MNLSRRELFSLALGRPQSTPQRTPQGSPPSPLLHLLNRLSYGPRPEEVAHASAVGYAAFLEEQLHPETVDDAAADAELQKMPILFMSRWDAHSLPNREYRCAKALAKGMITRAVLSRRQLLERMAEFWSDHFNIPADEYAPDLIQFQRDVIRKHALGNFRDMLIETAKSPAMLRYLNNDANVAGNPNENYARELMELYTLGVDGGYTESDVKEVARAFTGWTIHNKTRTGFYFRPEDHDTGAKLVLGHALPADRGLEDGLHVLSITARHPSTAHFVCRKLCVRFVSDNPPQALVDQLAATWQETGGEIKPVLRQLFLSTEFQSAVGQKLRRPLDFLIGALRATGTHMRYDWQLEQVVNELGQPPYGWHPPNGYPDVAGAWASTGGLLARWNTAMLLTHSAYSDAQDSGWGLTTEIRQRIGAPTTAGELVDAVATQVFGEPLDEAERQPFINYVVESGAAAAAIDQRLLGRKLGSLYGLMLASPHFQWR